MLAVIDYPSLFIITETQKDKLNMNRCLTRALSVCSQRAVWSRAVQPPPVLAKLQPITVNNPPVNIQLRAQFSSESSPVQEKIAGLVKNDKVVIFMKGVPTAPQCGFSNAVVQIMR